MPIRWDMVPAVPRVLAARGSAASSAADCKWPRRIISFSVSRGGRTRPCSARQSIHACLNHLLKDPLLVPPPPVGAPLHLSPFFRTLCFFSTSAPETRMAPTVGMHDASFCRLRRSSHSEFVDKVFCQSLLALIAQRSNASHPAFKQHRASGMGVICGPDLHLRGPTPHQFRRWVPTQEAFRHRLVHARRDPEQAPAPPR